MRCRQHCFRTTSAAALPAECSITCPESASSAHSTARVAVQRPGPVQGHKRHEFRSVLQPALRRWLYCPKGNAMIHTSHYRPTCGLPSSPRGMLLMPILRKQRDRVGHPRAKAQASRPIPLAPSLQLSGAPTLTFECRLQQLLSLCIKRLDFILLSTRIPHDHLAPRSSLLRWD